MASRCSAGPSELDALEPAVAADQLADRLLAHAHAGALQRGALAVQARGAVGESTTSRLQPDTTSAERAASGPEPCTASEQVAHLPAVAERAVEDRAAPEPLDARQRRRVVAQAVREHQRARAHRAPPSSFTSKPSASRLGVEHLAVADLDVREAGELLAAGACAARREHAVWASRPPIPFDAALAGRPVSSTSTRRRARPSTSAALRPAGPPPTMTASTTGTRVARECVSPRRRSAGGALVRCGCSFGSSTRRSGTHRRDAICADPRKPCDRDSRDRAALRAR